MVTTMTQEQNLIKQKTEKSDSVAPATPNPHNEIKAIFDPPTELSIACAIEASERSFIKDRRWAGQRTAEIVEKKFGGYDKVTNEQLSLATKQAWDERVSVCQTLTAKAEPESGNHEAKDTAETEATEKPEPNRTQ